MSLQEPAPKARSIVIPIKFKDKRYDALLDTGAEHNYVSDKELESDNLAVIKNTETKKVELANGTIINTYKGIEIRMRVFDGSPFFRLWRKKDDILVQNPFFSPKIFNTN
ncbi:hypothetical protein DMUE_3645 [Dictyocoela muelleri]|nr:hypothetical protein DMUE_3645 [Dictyocoela muelleri]